jgi:hypothetical protein
MNVGPPQGLRFDPAFLSIDEERGLLVELEQLDFRAIVLHGVPARRTARHFGLDYDYERRVHLKQAEPLPTWLDPLRAPCAALAGVPPRRWWRPSSSAIRKARRWAGTVTRLVRHGRGRLARLKRWRAGNGNCYQLAQRFLN